MPALISNKVNIWREVEGDRAGIVSEDTLEGTRGLMQAYSEMPAEKKQAMRQAALRCFEQRFEINKAAEALQCILQKVIAVN